MTDLAVTIHAIDYPQTYPLRHAVLWPNKPLAYVAVDDDPTGRHYGAFAGSELVAVISLFISAESARFRKFATHPDYQRRGIGTQLLDRVMADARLEGATRIWCDARLASADFYRKAGMAPEGPVFYKGDVPYSRMSRSLA